MVFGSTAALERDLSDGPKTSSFYVEVSTEQHRIIQDHLKQLLEDFDSLCRENNWDYCLVAGSLIGAVREGDMLDWDDDIDVVIPRSHFTELSKASRNQTPIGSNNLFITPEEFSGITTHSSFLKKGTTMKTLLGDPYPENLIGIDVLPVDSVPNQKIFRSIRGTLFNLLLVSFSSQRCLSRQDPFLNQLARHSLPLRLNLILRKLLSLPTVIIGKQKTLRLLNYLSASDDSHATHETVAYGIKKYFGEIVPQGTFFPSVEISFGGLARRSPNNAHHYLLNRYGEYLTPPPKQEQTIRKVRKNG